MENLYFKAVVAGVCFGFWPLLMNRSGLSGNLGMIIFSSGCLAMMLPFLVSGGFPSITDVRWVFATAACSIGAVGMILFGGVISKATPEAMPTYYLITVILQVVTAALYQAASTGSITASKIAGFVAAIVACRLLT